MSALARFMSSYSMSVSGYDRTASLITDILMSESIDVNFSDSTEAIPHYIKENNRKVLVIYTPAIPDDNMQLQFFRRNHYPLVKRSEVVGMISSAYENISVGGTHGKTSTSWMLAHILKYAGRNVYALLGGISANYNTNYLHGKGLDGCTFVIEADEYDRSFLRLAPDIGIITSVESDHLDIYGDFKSVSEAYQLFAQRIKNGGKLLHYDQVVNVLPLKAVVKQSYGFSENAQYRATNIRLKNDNHHFDFVSDQLNIKDIVLPFAGRHGILNALPCIAVAAVNYGVKEEVIKEALINYKGVKRRMEVVLNEKDRVYIDDYAHHPTEIEVTLTALRERFPGKKITAIFQPHLFSRTKDFAGEFAKSLSMADRVALLDIYPARELPIEGVDSGLILNQIKLKDRIILKKEQVLDYVMADENEVLVTLGAGDIDRLVEPIKEAIKNR